MTWEEKSKRYGTWLFQSLWVPGSLSITNENASGWPVNVDAAIIHDLLGHTALPCNLRSAQLKYKLSDLQLALNKSPVSLPVAGYIQSIVHRAVDRDQLLSWFPATWSPVLRKLDTGRTRKIRNGCFLTPHIGMCKCLANCRGRPQTNKQDQGASAHLPQC